MNDKPIIPAADDNSESQAVALRNTNEQLQSEIVKRQRMEDELRRSLDRAERSRRAMLGTLEDQKRVEDALRESQALYHSLVEQLPAGVFRKDPEGRFVFVSPEFCRLKGMKAEEFLGKTPQEVAASEVAKQDAAGRAIKYAAVGADHHRLIMQTGKPVELVEEYTHADGKKQFVKAMKLPVLDPDGKVIGTQGILFDITELKRAEESHARLATAVQHAAETIVITDPSGAILYVNPAFEKTAGYTREEVIGQNPRVLKSGKHDAEFYRRMWAALTAGQVWSGHLINKRKDGTLYDEDTSISPVLDAAGKIVNYVAVKHDVTEQKKLQAQMLRTQRLESVGRLASGIAHDLNNILAPMLMSPPLLREAIHDPFARQMVDLIEAGAIRGAGIIKQLLTFGRGMEGERVPVQIRALVKDMCNIIAETFPKNITTRRESPQDIWLVSADATQLHQVLMNLCINARDAMPEGGKLTIKLENCELDESFAQATPGASPGRYVCLSVTDTGQGIAPEHLDKIYDPFFTTKEAGKGTGLGLSTVLGIVQSHGGFIQVRSELGRGTQFKAYLPVSDEAEAEPADQAKQLLPQGHGELVLVVDDEQSVRQVTRQILERNGYRTIEAANGAEGMTQYVAHQQDVRVVVTDLAMPTMDGATLIRALRRLNPQVRVIAVSGHQSQSDLPADLEVPEEARLSKPFGGAVLLKALKRVLHPEKAGPGAEGKQE
jgi:two-component system, cell cycle sensor histidine kinase and response regulator CckA